MRPVVVTSVLLLVVLMFMSDSAAEMCKTKYLPKPCKTKLGEGWVQMNKQFCVKAFYETLSYTDAQRVCSDNLYGNLVSIHNDDDQSQVQCAMYRANTRKANYWIGATLFESHVGKNVWTWTDGSRFDYNKWAPGQPDNYMKTESCVEMISWDSGFWNDASCTNKKSYVCAVLVS
ncbi:galactose-specific lectin nattectin-like [Sander lucioperca]|uniref:galactose-specific lectin nattectin-like n=1 Tax=Sander lucioperca TaxID=283035 RepID=UPI00125D33A2|nr:galactose-specific lectin nattectin-like [Sander lucioperca]